MSMDNAEFEEKMLRWGVKPPDDSKEEVTEKQEKSEVVKYDPRKFLEDSISLHTWCSAKFERPKDVVKALSTGNHLAEAAATLFGYCYADLRCTSPEKQIDSETENIEDYYPKDLYEGALSEESWKSLQRMYNFNIDMYSELIAIRDEFPMDDIDDIKYPHGPKRQALKSYVEVMLCATLTILRGNDPKEYDLYESLSDTYQIIRSGAVREAENFTVEKFKFEKFKFDGKLVIKFEGVLDLLACMACAVVCYSYAHMESQLKPEYDRDYKSAFYAYVEAMTFVNKMGLSLEYVEFPPFLCKGIDDQQLTKILDTWEQMKKNPGMVKNWREMYDSFKKLLEIAQNDAEGGNWEHYDDDMTADMPFLEYLQRQLEFCKAYMDQKERREIDELEEIKRHEKRMKIDFFSEGLWDDLEEGTKDEIIKAESEWYDWFNRGSSVQSAFVHYSNAIETELHSIIFKTENVQKYVKDILKKQRKKGQEKYKKLMELKSLKAETLYLSDMANLLSCVEDATKKEDVEPIKDTIESLPILEDKKKILTSKDFTEFLIAVYRRRNKASHRDKMEDPLKLRNEILGIGCPGYLVKLAEIKKQIKTTSKNG